MTTVIMSVERAASDERVELTVEVRGIVMPYAPAQTSSTATTSQNPYGQRCLVRRAGSNIS